MRHGSLFSGIGAAEIAAEMLGWENVFHCEINPFGRQVLDYWFPNSASYEDVTKTDFTSWRGKVDILTGGFPCQPFSYAGKRGGQTDDRYLWHEMLRVIDQVRPMWVVGENVNGITTMVESIEVSEVGSESSLFQEGDGIHRYRAEQTFTIERVCKDLESIGYSVQPMCIPAAAVGAPHRRDRIFIIAYNVADTDSRDDMRKAGEYEGEGEGLQERHSIRKPRESGDVRSKGEESSEDSLRCGFFFGNENEQGSERNKRNSSARDSKRICGEERLDASDSGGKGLEEWMSDGFREDSKEERARVDNRAERFGINGRTTRMHPEERWAAFPSVSAVHRGNDGLPFDVDNLTIPFTKWRTESLKAYGNAIVPQVLYQIFKCIDEL